MGLNIFSSKLSELSKDQFIRFDTDYLNIYKKFNQLKPKYLKNYITFIETGKAITRTDYAEDNSEYAHIVVRNIKNGDLVLDDLVYLTEEKGEDLANYRLENGEILIAISSNVGFSCLLQDLPDDIYLTLSHYILRLRINEQMLNPKFLVYYLNSDLMKSYFRSVETGKTLKNLSKVYIHNLPILFNLDLNQQNEVVKKIEPIEQEIQNLKLHKKEHLEIINEVFGDELDFNWQEFNRLKNEKIFSSSLFDFSNNKDLRCSYKFHNLEYQFLHNFLTHKTSKKIKDFIGEPIVLGKGISPSLYDDDGDYYYIAMSNIKNYTFETEDCKKVGIEFYKQNINKSIKVNDILLARSGEGTIGKVAIIEDDEVEGIFADFTMRIRLENYNSTFAYYYFRSDFFQYLVYTHKKGLGNNTNIFPSQIQEFPILDFALEKQQQIVEKIKFQIDAQKLIDQQIEQKQNEISNLIYHCVQGS